MMSPSAIPDTLPDDAEREALVGDWPLWQRRRGHRTSTDDVVTAARAASLVPGAARYLDIGCGVGSVMLLVAHALRPGRTVGVEAQGQSVALLRRTLGELPDPPPIEVIHGDLREVDPAALGRFDLITGSPPYFPLGTGVLPPDPQRQACRFELRGGVEDYAAAAGRLLADDGVFVMVAQTALAARVERGTHAASLAIRSRLDLWMREDRTDPFLTVFELRRTPGECVTTTLAVRTAAGAVSDGYAALRAVVGLATHASDRPG
ncbi:MAG: methyltransferase domain-containing protein [Myxococcales bacterium]|nr:MAG: methyltransferase domain-containing protein [Myxococcales bacterium]